MGNTQKGTSERGGWADIGRVGPEPKHRVPPVMADMIVMGA